MCLAIPGKIVEIMGKHAQVDFGGVRRKADVSFIENPGVGDYVLVHVGFAIQKVDERIALETYRLLAEVHKAELKEEVGRHASE
ncbi:MAG: HypC/HybG/HupF family hydrogenase formation chaperone [archaeon]